MTSSLIDWGHGGNVLRSRREANIASLIFTILTCGLEHTLPCLLFYTGRPPDEFQQTQLLYTRSRTGLVAASIGIAWLGQK